MDKDSLWGKIIPIVDDLTLIRLKMKQRGLSDAALKGFDELYNTLSDELVEIIVSENMESVANKISTNPH